MGATSQLTIPYPELPDVADGPDGFKDIADRVEYVRPIVRTTSTIRTYAPAGGIPVGATKQLIDQTFTSTAIGYVDIEFWCMALKLNEDSIAVNSDGELILIINDQRVSANYYHTFNRSSGAPAAVRACFNLPKEMTTFNVKLWMSVGAASSSPMVPGFVNGNINQIGAPRT